LRILVVDDDPASVEALCELLEAAGHDVDRAENGSQALELLRDGEKFCVILLDVMMPVMNGYEFREEQLKDPSLASIPVFLVTADSRARKRAEELQTARFFQKPVSPRDLLSAVGEYCGPAPAAKSRQVREVRTS
jgi:CheY-like chemotaxis protein